MKKKDIIVVIICVLVITACVFIIFRSLSPKADSTSTEKKETIEFTGNIDEEGVKKLKERKDYGQPNMENIGRENPFARL